jgi:hypothetical protein
MVGRESTVQKLAAKIWRENGVGHIINFLFTFQHQVIKKKTYKTLLPFTFLSAPFLVLPSSSCTFLPSLFCYSFNLLKPFIIHFILFMIFVNLIKIILNFNIRLVFLIYFSSDCIIWTIKPRTIPCLAPFFGLYPYLHAPLFEAYSVRLFFTPPPPPPPNSA